MASKISSKTPPQVVLIGSILLLLLPAAHFKDDAETIPADEAKLNDWFESSVGQFKKLQRGAVPGRKVINVRADGSGEFKTITEAIDSIRRNNRRPVTVSIGPGNYTEKLRIASNKPYITLLGDPKSNPILVNDGWAAKHGKGDSGTLIIEADYFTAVNLKIVNSSPRPDGKLKEAVAMRIMGDFAAFYNCYFHGFQNTLMDDMGRHFYKDCYIEGTVDFIFGCGQSLYLNSEIHVIPGDPVAFIAAQARSLPDESTGYVFVHCKVTGTGGSAYLGRTWFDYARTIFAYSDLSDVVRPEGWSNDNDTSTDRTAFFGEYKNTGPGASLDKRVSFLKKMTDVDVQPFLSLNFINAAPWLRLPPSPIQQAQ